MKASTNLKGKTMYETKHLTQDEMTSRVNDRREVYTHSVEHAADMAIADLQHCLAEQTITGENHEMWMKLAAARGLLNEARKLLGDRITIDGLTVSALTRLAQQYEEGLS